jgi:hypothetical protein
LTSSLNINDVLPKINMDTVSADVLAVKVANETLKRLNTWQVNAVTALETSAKALTYTALSTTNLAYDVIVDAVQAFKTANKAAGIKATAVLVSPTFKGYLQKDDRFLRSTPMSDAVLAEGDIRMVAGAALIECADLGTYDFMVMHSNGLAAPINVNSLVVADGTAAGYPGGTIIGGELGYGFKVVQPDPTGLTDDTSAIAYDKSLPTGGYLVAGYTQAV